MSLTCPGCGLDLGLRLAALSLNSEPQLAPVSPQTPVEPQRAVVEEERTTEDPSPKRTRFSYPDGRFLVFWKNYPRKVGKAEAYSKWLKAVREVEAQTIIDAAAIYGARCKATSVEQRFIPYPEKWLNHGRWEDVADDAPKQDARYQPYDHEAHLRALEDV